MQKYIIIALFCSVFNAAFAQMVVPGYQGKRLSAEVNVVPTFAVLGPTAEGVGSTSQTLFNYKKGIGLEARYELSLNYAVSRQYALTLDYAFGQTGFFTEASSTPSIFYTDLVILNKVNFSHIGFGYNGFAKRGGGLAPIGNYFSIKVLYLTAQTEHYKKAPLFSSLDINNLPTPTTLTPAIEKTLYNLTTPSAEILSFQMGFGTRRILHKHIFFNFSTFGGFSLNVKQQKPYGDSQSLSYKVANDDASLYARMAGQYLFYFQFGVGYLIL